MWRSIGVLREMAELSRGLQRLETKAGIQNKFHFY